MYKQTKHMLRAPGFREAPSCKKRKKKKKIIYPVQAERFMIRKISLLRWSNKFELGPTSLSWGHQTEAGAQLGAGALTLELGPPCWNIRTGALKLKLVPTYWNQ